MTKRMAEVDHEGIILNLIVAQPATPDTATLVSVPDGVQATVGGHIFEGQFYAPQPFPSWTRNEGEWVPPIAFPGGLCLWDEELGEWVKPEKPFESWVWDEDTCLWVAPVAYPEDGESYSWDEDAGDWIATDV